MNETTPNISSPSSRLTQFEDSVSLTFLLLMAAIPISEIILRRFSLSIPGSIRLVQVLTLWVGLSGALIATREDRHLALTSGVSILKRPAVIILAFVVSVLSVSVTAALASGAFTTILEERHSTEDVALGIPAWIPQMALPIGYAAIAIRLAWVKGRTLLQTLAILAPAAVVLWGLSQMEWELAEFMVGPLMAILIASAFLGAPIYVVLGGAALVLFWGAGGPIAAVSVETVRQIEDETLPVLPLFTFTGYVLAESKSSERLVEAFRGVFGWLPGGMAVMTAVVCAFFTTFTGASGVTILALGGLLYPVLRSEGYPERFSVGLLTASGSIGLLFPPALPVIIYGVVAGVPIDRLFVAGLVPGLILVGALSLLGIRTAITSPDISRTPFNLGRAWRGIRGAWLELAIPLVAVGAYFSGLASLLESAALTALYALIIEVGIHRDLKPSDLLRVGRDSAALVGGVLLIFGVAMGLTNYLNDEMVPTMVLEWVETRIDSQIVFLAALNIILLAVGCFMDIFSALVVVVPLIAPLGKHFGIDPIHLGIIFLANLELGFLTPPVGMNLFLSSYRFNRPLPEVYRTVLPFLLVLLLAVLLITYVPVLTMGPVEWAFPPSVEAPPPIEF